MPPSGQPPFSGGRMVWIHTQEDQAMRNLYLALPAVVLLAASPAPAMKGPQVPLSASTASQFDVTVSGGGGTSER